MPLKYLAVIDLPAIAHPTESISYTETTHFTTGIETLTPLDSEAQVRITRASDQD